MPSRFRPHVLIPPNPITRTAGPHKLPKLLSMLPNNGKMAVLQPSQGESDTFWLITRPKLRFKAYGELEERDTRPPIDGVPLARGPRLPFKEVSPMQGGELRVFGGAHAMRFKNGYYQPPRIKSSLPDERINHSLKSAWVAVDPSAIPPETSKAIEDWKTAYGRHMDIRKELLAKRVVKFSQMNKEGRIEYREKQAAKAARLEAEMKVKIIY